MKSLCSPFVAIILFATVFFTACQSKEGSANSDAHKKLVADHATISANHQTMEGNHAHMEAYHQRRIPAHSAMPESFTAHAAPEADHENNAAHP